MLSPRTRIVAVGHVSNTLGAVNPVREMAALAKENRQETIVLIDGAQAVSHMNVDVQELGCDLYAFSGHKLYAPTGIGALWGKRELLEKLPPWMGGGEMIKESPLKKPFTTASLSNMKRERPTLAGQWVWRPPSATSPGWAWTTLPPMNRN